MFNLFSMLSYSMVTMFLMIAVSFLAKKGFISEGEGYSYLKSKKEVLKCLLDYMLEIQMKDT